MSTTEQVDAGYGPLARAIDRQDASDRGAARRSDDDFVAHYFRMIDPAVAASFTKEQRIALRTMFGGRGATRHPVDIRCTFPLGWRRFYLVLLIGRDRRKFIRAMACQANSPTG